MKKIKINGKRMLSGEIEISGAKNSVVALIPAAILTDEQVVIKNVPKLSDTENLERILGILGAKITFRDSELIIDSQNLKNCEIPGYLASTLRASYYFMGALLARFRHVEISLPGGCTIGKRPIDYHLEAFKKMGVSVSFDEKKYILDAEELCGATIDLPFPSVGATVNIVLAAVLAKGTTIIKNAACEPEIVNLQNSLNSMGGKISGAGTSEISIIGVEKLHSADLKVIPDRIEAGTYIIIGALMGKNLSVKNAALEYNKALLKVLDEMRCNYEITADNIEISKCINLHAVDIETLAYPGFPTDLGQPMTVLMAIANGKSHFHETIWENRIGHFPELKKMGAVIDFTSDSATIQGPSDLKGAQVIATDLRAGAALIAAALSAKGTTIIGNIEYILRGYEDIVNKLKKVGADIEISD